ncbi:glycosyltransferase family 4 protein [Cupriavidus basilensis]|uniref:glycosyltransferase family 4 protein n=1 Tax=Cupriavidus basilensis TaxID=68895 RepID=UPI0023E81A37|nr:glycosyltransferase family 1 protein [Cupriavidus basilensis]MDF3886713.1 glycosyltransferase family 1 protein [Cupriavidus basilensis]
MTRILIDCTRTVQAGLHTGIQRVVRQTLCHGTAAAHGDGPPAIPVMLQRGRFVAVPRVDPHPFEHAQPIVSTERGPITFTEHDVLLLADAAWHANGIALAAHHAHNEGARIVPLVHDLISIQFPQWFDAGVGARFRAFLDAVLPIADRVVSVSHTTDRALLGYLHAHEQPSLRALAETLVRHVNPPGADAGEEPGVLPVSPRVRAVFDTTHACLIQVGSIEPRKNHDLVLDACEMAWNEGAQLRLVLIGAHGWKMAHFADRLARHPQLDRNLFHLQHVTDADLAHAYGEATASIHASTTEGFGLPIAEAGRFRVPVLLSDTPIHREVGGPHATYYPLKDRSALAALLAKAARGGMAFERNWARPGQHRSWAQSTGALIALLAQRTASSIAA